MHECSGYAKASFSAINAFLVAARELLDACSKAAWALGVVAYMSFLRYFLRS